MALLRQTRPSLSLSLDPDAMEQEEGTISMLKQQVFIDRPMCIFILIPDLFYSRSVLFFLSHTVLLFPPIFHTLYFVKYVCVHYKYMVCDDIDSTKQYLALILDTLKRPSIL